MWILQGRIYTDNFILSHNLIYTAGCRYTAVQCNMRLYTSLQLPRRNINQSVDPQRTTHSSHLLVHCGLSSVRIFKKIDRVVTAPHCTVNSDLCNKRFLRNLPSKGIGALTMMTSSNGIIFRVTGHLCGEFTDHWWIPRTKASDAELWCFLWSALE